ncbi:Nramp family divalent metal transporter [Enemella evansiae]|uniref:Nramp family divalent metal transporter n=1 Tax=Enemella evansiae TaxID=2016499 RepID=UPI000B9663B6|nr:Nramp family divalent metal transporter [Enemella evansiae]OYN99060.1 manganese transporter [Enemella evansiae]OYO01390.1 manganese transporter [Enemella evansiae]
MTRADPPTQPMTMKDDPYLRTADGIKEPPVGWRRSIRYFGPGLIMSAAVVGAGELIATTALGAEAGFVILWLVVFSTLVKVAVQIELARWTIVTGQPALTGYNKVPPRLGRLGWINVLWLLLALSKMLQAGGIVGSVAVAFSILLPIGGDPLAFRSIAVWTVVVVIGTVAGLYASRYELIEKVAVLLVMVFSVVTVLLALGLPFTPFAYGADDIAGGLTFSIPIGALGAAIAMFGLTGVSVDEITSYPYWCIEKGYARWVGPNDGSEAWQRRAKGWIGVMYKDAALSWVVYTITTTAFFIMGAAVLHPQGIVPVGNELLTTLSRLYTDVLGEWANVFFLVGAIAVLGSTLWAATPAWARMFANFTSTAGAFDWMNTRAREKWIRGFTIGLPVVWGAVYLFVQSPVAMILIGGIFGGVFLVVTVIAVWYLRRKETDARLRGGWLFRLMLIVSSVAIGLLGVYSLAKVFGFEIG